MKSLFKKIGNKDEADKLIKDATLLLYIIVGLTLINALITDRQALIIVFIESILITLLRRYKSRISGLLLILLFLPPLITQSENVYLSGKGLDIVIEYLIRIFLGVRALEATFKFYGRFSVSERHVAIGYKIYFWLIVAFIGLVNSDLYFFGKMNVYDYIDLPFSLLGFVGLFGYAYRKTFFNAVVWKLTFFVIIFWDAAYGLFLYELRSTSVISLRLKVGIILFVSCLLLPYYFGLYRYGYKSDDIWNKKNRIHNN